MAPKDRSRVASCWSFTFSFRSFLRSYLSSTHLIAIKASSCGIGKSFTFLISSSAFLDPSIELGSCSVLSSSIIIASDKSSSFLPLSSSKLPGSIWILLLGFQLRLPCCLPPDMGESKVSGRSTTQFLEEARTTMVHRQVLTDHRRPCHPPNWLA